MSTSAEGFRGLLERWLARTVRSQELHYKAADVTSRKNLGIGLLGIVLGIGVALNSQYPRIVADIVPVVAGIGAAIACAAQMKFAWADVAEGHKAAGVQMGQIRRNIEQVLASGDQITELSVNEIREQVSLVLPHVPRIPFDFYSND